MNKRISIIMTYTNRRQQLFRTLASMVHSAIDDFHIVIANDSREDLSALRKTHDNIHVIQVENKTWINQLPGYNMALKYAIDNLGPDIIIVQNPESMHVGDVLKYVHDNVTETNYLTMACFSLNREQTFRGGDFIWNDETTIREYIAANDKRVTTDGGTGWYNHPMHRPVMYEFCAAMSVNNMIALNGYDERMAYGIAYDDDYMLHRVRMLGLRPEIVVEPFVVHQWHEPANEHPDKTRLVQKNHALFNTLRAQGQFRAEHLITPDL